MSPIAVNAIKVIEHSTFARLHGRATATTRKNAIFLRGSGEDFFADADLVLHEYAHVLKQWNTGELTAWRYVVEWLRKGYWESRYEIAAREFARRHVERFRRMVGVGEKA